MQPTGVGGTATLRPMTAVSRVLAHAARTAPSCGPVHVIGVDGRSGSGKTTLAIGIARAWSAPLVSMDELYPGWDGLAAAPGILHEHVLLPVAKGEDAAVPTWDWSASRPGPLRDLHVGQRLVVEGCGSTAAPAGALIGTRVWLEGSMSERRRRAVARDGELMADHWDMWAAQEERLFTREHTRERAHLVLPMPEG